MYKKIRSSQCLFLGLILLLLGACTTKQDHFNDWQQLHLEGKVKHLEEWTYSSYAAFNKNQHRAQEKTWFSKEGLLHKNVFHEPSGRLIWTYYHYQKDSVWVRRTFKDIDRPEQTQNYWLYELNQYGQQEVLTSLLLDSSIFHKITISYNSKQQPNNMVYSEKKDPSLVPCQIDRTYNEEGLVQQELTYVYDRSNQQCFQKPTTATYTYNEQGDILRENILYYTGAKESYSYQYRYDTLGNWINRLHYKGDKVIEVTKRRFAYYQ